MAVFTAASGRCVLAAAAILLAIGVRVDGGVVYVSGSAPAGGSGCSWASPIRAIQQGIDKAAQTRSEVWVRSGTYLENVRLADGVFLFGGFAGSETLRDRRDPSSNPTVIDGGFRGSVVSATEVSGCGLDGFVIRNGTGTRHDTGTYLSGVVHGGGIYIHRSAVSVSGNVITGNSAADTGGGIHVHAGSVDVIGNTIIGNQSGGEFGSGGGVYVDQSSECRIAWNIIANNECFWDGGAIHCTVGSSPVIEHNLLLNNRGGAGGAIHCNFDSSPRVAYNTIAGNWARNGGGAVSFFSYCHPVIVGNIIAGNAADQGGALKRYVDATSQPTIAYNDFHDNGFAPFHGLDSLVNRDGNFSADPLFLHPAYGDYRVSPHSQCVDSGDPAVLDPDGSRSDVGAYPAEGHWYTIGLPDTRITSNPGPYTLDTVVTVGWAGVDSEGRQEGLAYSYRMDAGPWSAWSSATEVTAPAAIGGHIFRVIARDAAGTVDPTPATLRFEVEATVLRIRNPSVAGVTSTSAVLSWRTNRHADSALYYGTQPVPQTRIDASGPARTFSLPLTGLAPATTHYVQARAWTPDGQEIASQVIRFRTSSLQGNASFAPR